MTDRTRTYTSHLTTNLLPSLEQVRRRLAKIDHEIAEYQDALAKLAGARAGNLGTMVELGAGVWADARVDDLDDVIFDMGVGILAELSVVEAVKYGEERIGVLRRKREVVAFKEKIILWQIDQFQGALENAGADSTGVSL